MHRAGWFLDFARRPGARASEEESRRAACGLAQRRARCETRGVTGPARISRDAHRSSARVIRIYRRGRSIRLLGSRASVANACTYARFSCGSWARDTGAICKLREPRRICNIFAVRNPGEDLSLRGNAPGDCSTLLCAYHWVLRSCVI